MTDWAAMREGLKEWFLFLSRVEQVEWMGEQSFQVNGPYATLQIRAISEIGTGWDNSQYNEEQDVFETERVSDKRCVLYARIRSFSQLPGEDAQVFMNRAHTLARGHGSLGRLHALGVSYHGSAGPITSADYEHQGHEMSQSNLELVLSFRSIITDEPITTINTIQGTLQADGEDCPIEIELGADS